MKKKTTKKRKALTISVHGQGIDIDARINTPKDWDAVMKNATAAFKRQMFGQMTDTVEPAVAYGPHDFDAVRRVVEHADLTVLEAVITLAQTKIEQRRTSS